MAGLEWLSIELVLVALIVVIMLFSLLIGLIQGVRKNFFNLCWTIIFWIVFWSTCNIFNLDLVLYNEKLYELLKGPLSGAFNSFGINIIGEYSNFMEAILGGGAPFFASYGIDIASLDKDGLQSLVNIIVAIANSFFKIAYLFIFIFIFSILKPIIYGIFFKKLCKEPKESDLVILKHKEEKYEKKNKGNKNDSLLKKIKHTENRLTKRKTRKRLGMITGVVRGLLSSFIVLCIVNSFFAIFPEIENQKANITVDSNNQVDSNNTNNEEEETSTLYDYICNLTGNNETVCYAISLIKQYKQSSLINSTKIKINGKYADDLFVEMITSGKSQDFTFSYREQLINIVQIANEAYKLTNGFNVDSVNWLALNDSQVKNVTNVLTIIAEDDFITNLIPAGIAIALSIDSIKAMLPEGTTINEKEYKSISWENEFKSLAGIVTDFYSLKIGTGNVDYLSLDETKIESLFNNISNLSSINFIGHVGSSIGLAIAKESLVGLEENIDSMASKLANMVFTDDIKSYGTLYTKFKEIIKDKSKDGYYNEDGSLNYLYYFTSLDLTKFSTIFDSVFETAFLTELMPDVMAIIRRILPNEYASIINPNVTTSEAWKNEINSVLTILASITDYGNSPWKEISKFDFSVLSGFSSESVCKSDLLSYAIITLFVQASNNEGFLSALGSSLSSSIQVPDMLKLIDENTHKYSSLWYGNSENNYVDGELYIMFNTITKCLSKITSLNSIFKDLPEILKQINASDLVNSKVLYYSIAALLGGDKLSDLIVIPTSCLQVSEDYFNGIKKDVISQKEITCLLNVFTDGKTLDLNKLIKYVDTEGKYDKYGNLMENPTNQEIEEAKNRTITTLSEQMRKDDTVSAELSFDVNSLTKVFTDESFYNKNELDEEKRFENVNSFFESKILRATASSFISEASDMMYIPESCKEVSYKYSSTLQADMYKQIDIITLKEFSALIASINELELDLNVLSNGELSSILGAFKDENDMLKDSVRKIMGQDGYDSKNYSGILHGTLSTNLLKYSSGSLPLKIPSVSLDSYDNSLIKPKEICDLLQSVFYIGISTLDSNDQSYIIDNSLTQILAHEDSLESTIFRATITSFISNVFNKKLADVCYESVSEKDKANNIKIFYKDDTLDLFKALDSIRVNSSEDSKFSDVVNNIDTIKVGTLVLADTPKDGNSYGSLSISLLFRAILTNNITTLKVPYDAKEKDVIIKDESKNLIKALGNLLDDDSTVDNVDNVTDLSFGKLLTSKEEIASSKILNTAFTGKIDDISAVIIPAIAYEDNTNYERLTVNEMREFIESIVSLFGEDTKISSISKSINNLSTNDLYNAKDDIYPSLVMNSTVTNKIKKSSDTTLIIPNQSFDELSNNTRLSENELNYFILSVYELLPNTKVSSIDYQIDFITFNTLYEASDDIADSYIMNATISKKIKTAGGKTLKIPASSYTNSTNVFLKKAELKHFFGSINAMFDDPVITQIGDKVKDFKIDLLGKAKDDISASNIMNATVTSKLKSLVIPKEAYVDSTATDKLLIEVEMGLFIDSVSTLLKDTMISKVNESISKLKFSTLEASKESVSNSLILNCTITDIIVDDCGGKEDDFLFIPNGSYANLSETTRLSPNELANFISSINVLANDSQTVSSFASDISDILDISNDDCVLFSLTDSKYNKLTSSIILSTNIRNKIVSANGGYFKVGLALDSKIAKGSLSDEDFILATNSLESINQSFEYTTISTTSIHSDVCVLLLSFKKLKDAGLLSSLTDTSGGKAISGINVYKQDSFIEIICECNILRDSLPNIIRNFNDQYNSNADFDSSKLNIPTKGDSRVDSISKSISYWQGEKDEDESKTYHYYNGELYKFIDFIIASVDLTSSISSKNKDSIKNDIKTMLKSDIAFDVVDQTYTNTTFVASSNTIASLNGQGANYLDPSTLNKVGGKNDWTDTNGLAYIDRLANVLTNDFA